MEVRGWSVVDRAELRIEGAQYPRHPSHYNDDMALDQTPDEAKAEYVRLMGPVGEMFAELLQDAARMHMLWNEFLGLFDLSAAELNTLNHSAPGFFFLVQDAWWNEIILNIFRMTDGNRKTLSLPNLATRLDVALRPGFEATLKTALAASTFAHALRHADIGHRNREVALKARSVPSSSRSQVEAAIAAIDDALQFVNHHYTGRGPTFYEHLDILGGSKTLLRVVKRGLEALNQDYADHRLPR